MPPNQKITREMILETGYTLVVDGGIESVDARSIAKILKCSTQPVFSQFSSMEELRQEIHDIACEIFEADILNNATPGSFMQSSDLKVVGLATNQSNVFHLIYLSRYCRCINFFESRMGFKSNNRIQEELKANISKKIMNVMM